MSPEPFFPELRHESRLPARSLSLGARVRRLLSAALALSILLSPVGPAWADRDDEGDDGRDAYVDRPVGGPAVLGRAVRHRRAAA